jgi:hypothetical protein
MRLSQEPKQIKGEGRRARLPRSAPGESYEKESGQANGQKLVASVSPHSPAPSCLDATDPHQLCVRRAKSKAPADHLEVPARQAFVFAGQWRLVAGFCQLAPQTPGSATRERVYAG